jgi:hypothetical protein
MAGTTTNGAREPRPNRRLRGCVIPLVLLAGWLVVGAVRAPMVARDYFAGAHGAGATVTNVEIHGSIPLIPPFWGVSIQGDVREPQMTGPGYISAMLLCIEPITGWVIVCGAG